VQVLRCRLKVALLVPLLATLSSCAIGSTGVVTARHTRTPTAIVVDLYTFGLQVRPSAFDGGATLGYRHVTYVYPRGESRYGEASRDREWLHCNLPAGAPLLLASRSVGLELQGTRQVSRLSFGYLSQTMLTSPVPAYESCLLQLDYAPAQPENTFVAVLTSAETLQAP
jgi:hypothetical protein